MLDWRAVDVTLVVVFSSEAMKPTVLSLSQSNVLTHGDRDAR